MKTWLPLVLVACSTPTGTVGGGYLRVLQTLPDPPSKLDVLFVIDDSGSIADDQRALVEAARTELFGQLQTIDGDLPDLHLAVVSTSVNVPGSSAQACDDDVWATDSSLLLPDGSFLLGPWAGRPTGWTQLTDGTLFLDDAPDGHGGRVTNFTGTLGDTFASIGMLGAGGCGYEAPLEAMRRALSGTLPENAGFLRDDAMLLVVFLADEDDSSVVDGTKWEYSNSDVWDANFREFEFGTICDPDDTSLGPRSNCAPRDNPGVIHGVGEYVDFLHTLKSDPSLVMVAGIVSPPGPVEVIQPPTTQKFALAGACTPPPGPCADDPTMICPRQMALPAVRLDAFMTEFAGRYALASICDQTMAMRVRQISRTVTGVMTNQPCLAGEHRRDLTADSCRAFDVAPDGSRAGLHVAIHEDAQACDYTPSHLRAELPPVANHHHVEIDCL